MNHVAMQQLIDALRSDGFVQGKRRLFREVEGVKKHCCLGVACVLAHRAGVIEELPWDLPEHAEDYENTVLPAKVSDWLGTASIDPSGPGNPDIEDTPIAVLNDHHLTFPQIADLLQRELNAHRAKELANA